MRVVLQRVTSGSVSVDGSIISSISKGIVCLVGICPSDTVDDVNWIIQKVLGAKLWENDDGKPWRKSVSNLNLEVLLVSQFTLYGTLNKKNVPDYKNAMSPDPARELYQLLVDRMSEKHKQVQNGEFGALMEVSLANDGPVTLVLDSLDHIPRKSAELDASESSGAAEGPVVQENDKKETEK